MSSPSALEEVLLPPHTSKSVMQQSHIQLSQDEYHGALSALESVFDAGRGDLLGKWPFFRTKLR